MTADEVRVQKAMLLLDYQEAEQELAVLEEKGTRISERIAAVAKWLEDASQRHYHIDRSEVYLSGGKRFDVLKDQQVRQAVNFDEVLELIQDLRVARSRVADLQKRKQALGLK